MMERQWEMTVSVQCSGILAAHVQCQVCQDRAVGHANVKGGEFDGRLVLVLCGAHVTEAGHDEVRAQVDRLVAAGLLDFGTGGPGHLGVPALVVINADPYDVENRFQVAYHHHERIPEL